ncbi:hypothetical protein HDU96_007381 [Phlyctochytrium bullatum]|nr:hypothetical protein HDU96_007381 [Phlyctochytrium bullatum]
MTIHSRFVSKAVVQPNTLSETPVGTNNLFGVEIDAPAKVQEYDPRSLYERLKEEREKKDAEWAERTKLGNQVKKVDDDEAQYYAAREDELARKRREQDQQIKEALNDYRHLVQEARSVPAPAPSLTGIAPVAVVSAAVTAVTAAPKRPVIDGIVVRKRKSEGGEEVEKAGSPTTPTTTGVVAGAKEKGKEKVGEAGVKKAKVEKEEVGKGKGKEEKGKAPAAPAPAAKPLAGLSSLAGYSDSDDD